MSIQVVHKRSTRLESMDKRPQPQQLRPPGSISQTYDTVKLWLASTRRRDIRISIRRLRPIAAGSDTRQSPPADAHLAFEDTRRRATCTIGP